MSQISANNTPPSPPPTPTHTPRHYFNLAGIFLCMALICFSSAPVLFGFFLPHFILPLVFKMLWLTEWLASVGGGSQCGCGRQLRDGWVKVTNFFNVLIFEVEMLRTPKENSLFVLKSHFKLWKNLLKLLWHISGLIPNLTYLLFKISFYSYYLLLLPMDLLLQP